MKPIIKWTGGKSQEIKYFEKWLQVKYDRYVEPFLGGGAVYFYLEPKNALINDLNDLLIQFYKDVAFNRESLIEELKTMRNDEEFYYNVRKMFNKEIPSIYSSSAILAYINRTSFSGLTRYSKGKKDKDGNYIELPKFNVPYGRYKNFHPWDFLTQEASDLLKTAEIVSWDFSKIFDNLTENDFVFLDPPYMDCFDTYLADGFNQEQHIKLSECFKSTNAKCLMIISDLGNVRELYDGYIKDSYSKTYAFNVQDRARENNNVQHLIIANYDI